MGKWSERAAALGAAEASPPPRVDDRAESFGLPDDLAAMLRRLEMMPAPRRLEVPGNWRGVVGDALRLAREGWVHRALALGWSAGDLFGIGPRDDWDFQGLALWVQGRRLVMIDDRGAVAADGDRFIRGGMRHGTHPTIEPVMLWEFVR